MSRPLNVDPSSIESGEATRRFVIEGRSFSAARAEPGLHVTATPIGNLADVTLRSLQTLAGVDAILCEDTRVTRKLTTRYGIGTKLEPYHDHNAAKVRPGILDRLQEGAAIALVSDAGTPLVSDPGYKLVHEARDRGIRLHAIPGPSAVLAGLTISGLPSDSFMFAGFLPNRAGDRKRHLAQVADVPATLIFFESAQRIEAALASVAEVMGNRPVAVTRELTKLHEEALTGTAEEVAAAIAVRGGVRGEITLLIGPPDAAAQETDDGDIDAEVLTALRTMSASRAAAHVAEALNLPRKRVYARALALKEASDGGKDA
ncbi:16S rRNA (cytidine1402-2'-O)-methyltransferase [Rhodoligotrophos appendicifer]|uniref:16S rRNA (cytidine(1402)-2'-O)-methyltransferase n=1 Tax=Rhodoligotrophos appendicifer TaxID=987056 RepID=UPI001FE27F10|nr:16S rRNA (cytidine(1402)-2'-O)-methyltransferase [Rhodoligotrophos appendicifer]